MTRTLEILSRRTACLLGLFSIAGCGTAALDESESVDDSADALSATVRIQAESYKSGGEGVGYHDTTAGNKGKVFRSDDVDIQATTDAGGGYNVGWIEAGEWLAYDAFLPKSATYKVTVRAASGAVGNKKFHLVIDGVVQPTVSFTDASGWQSWKTVTAGTFALKGHGHSVRFVAETAGFNVNYLDFAPVAGTERPSWGVSATAAGQPFPQAYAESVANLHSSAVFYYFPAGKNPVWGGNLAGVPGDHDIVVSSKVHDLAVIQTFVDAVPKDRHGLVYFNYWQEPEDDFPTPAAQATYRQRASAIAPIVKAHPRMRFGVCLMNWSLNPASGRDWHDWIVPEMDHIGWSLYDATKGDADKAGSGIAAVDAIANAMATDGRPWGAIAWGFSLNAANYTLHDREIRAQWMRDAGQELVAKGATHGMWFNRVWNDTDYTIETDAYLMDAWNDVISY